MDGQCHIKLEFDGYDKLKSLIDELTGHLDEVRRLAGEIDAMGLTVTPASITTQDQR